MDGVNDLIRPRGRFILVHVALMLFCGRSCDLTIDYRKNQFLLFKNKNGVERIWMQGILYLLLSLSTWIFIPACCPSRWRVRSDLTEIPVAVR